MSASSQVLGTDEASKAIARSVAWLHKEHLGKGPKRVECFLLPDCVLVLLHEGHTAGEETLQRLGEEEAVAIQRVRLSAAIRDELIAAVEVATERKVIGLLSSSQLEPSLLSHVFVLQPSDFFDPDL